MPVMDGLTLIGQLLEVPSMIKAIVVSVYGDIGNIRSAINNGAFDFVIKLIDLDELKLMISRRLKHLQMLRKEGASHAQLVALRQELYIALRMQQQIFPGHSFGGSGYDVGAQMTLAKAISGDFDNYSRIDDYRFSFAIADVSWRGEPAGLHA